MPRRSRPVRPLELQDIEEMRRQAGIDDVELRMRIRLLKAGDRVKLTAVTGPASCANVVVRITSMRGSTFRGKVANTRAVAGLPQLRPGASIAFTTAHIHSLPSVAVAHDS